MHALMVPFGERSGRSRVLPWRDGLVRTVAAVIAMLLALVPMSAGLAETDDGGSDRAGAVLAWGDDSEGQLGPEGPTADPDDPAEYSEEPVEAMLDGDVVGLAAGGVHSLALLEDGTVRAWGRERSALGAGDRTPLESPEPPREGADGPVLNDVADIAAGRGHSLALREDGTVWVWGNAWCAQHGEGFDPTGFLFGPGGIHPRPVQGLPPIQAIAAGGSFNLALDVDGQLWAWGDNTSGQLGNPVSPYQSPETRCEDSGWNVKQPEPVRVLLPEQSGAVLDFAAGSEHAVALTADGLVWSWGSNCEGQLGTSAGTVHLMPRLLVPLPVFGLEENVVGLAAGGAGAGGHSLALTSDGSVWAWGLAEILGAGERNGQTSPCAGGHELYPEARGPSYPSPVQVRSDSAPLDSVVAISGGTTHSLAISADGMLWAWGHNDRGQLGLRGGHTRATAQRVDIVETDHETSTAGSEPGQGTTLLDASRHSLATLGTTPTAPRWDYEPSPLSEAVAQVPDDGDGDDRPDPDEAEREIDERTEEVREETDPHTEEIHRHLDEIEAEIEERTEELGEEVDTHLEEIRDRIDGGDSDDEDDEDNEDEEEGPFNEATRSLEELDHDGEGGRLFFTTRRTDRASVDGTTEGVIHSSERGVPVQAAQEHLRRMVGYVTSGGGDDVAGLGPVRLLVVNRQPTSSGRGFRDAGFSPNCSDEQLTPPGCFDRAYTWEYYGTSGDDGPHGISTEEDWDEIGDHRFENAEFANYDAVVIGSRVREVAQNGDELPSPLEEVLQRREELYEYVNAGGGLLVFSSGRNLGSLGEDGFALVPWLERQPPHVDHPDEGAMQNVIDYGPFSVTEEGTEAGLTEAGANSHGGNRWFEAPSSCVMERAGNDLAISYGAPAPISVEGSPACEDGEEDEGDPPSGPDDPVPNGDDDGDGDLGLDPPDGPGQPVNSLPNPVPGTNPGGSPGGAPGGSSGAPAGAPGGAAGAAPGGAPGGAPGTAPGGAPGTAPGAAGQTGSVAEPSSGAAGATTPAEASSGAAAPAPTGAASPTMMQVPGLMSEAGPAAADSAVDAQAAAGQLADTPPAAAGHLAAIAERERQVSAALAEAETDSGDAPVGGYLASGRQPGPLVPLGAAIGSSLLALAGAWVWHRPRPEAALQREVESPRPDRRWSSEDPIWLRRLRGQR